MESMGFAVSLVDGWNEGDHEGPELALSIFESAEGTELSLLSTSTTTTIVSSPSADLTTTFPLPHPRSLFYLFAGALYGWAAGFSTGFFAGFTLGFALASFIGVLYLGLGGRNALGYLKQWLELVGIRLSAEQVFWAGVRFGRGSLARFHEMVLEATRREHLPGSSEIEAIEG